MPSFAPVRSINYLQLGWRSLSPLSDSIDTSFESLPQSYQLPQKVINNRRASLDLIVDISGQQVFTSSLQRTEPICLIINSYFVPSSYILTMNFQTFFTTFLLTAALALPEPRGRFCGGPGQPCPRSPEPDSVVANPEQ